MRTNRRHDVLAVRRIVAALAVDIALVVVFAVVGRASHERALTLGGIAQTAWPFLLALGLAWAVMRAWRAPYRVLPTGVGIWLVTVAAGLVLRAVSGQGVAVAFAIVATLVLAALLMGWRAVAALVGRRGPARPEGDD